MPIVADIFRQAAQLNRSDPRRAGNIVELRAGRVLAGGDFHGHRTNLAKVIEYAALGATAATAAPDQLVLQEVIHGELTKSPHGPGAFDRSIDLLLRVARLKIAHPGQVTLLLSNHDIAQVTGNEIMKNGLGYCRSFEEGVRQSYPEGWEDVLAAVKEFLASQPLAARCANGVFLAHSVPSPKRMELAGTDILQRLCDPPADFRRGGPAYEWTWGRDPSQEQLDALAAKLGVSFFLLGHKHITVGCEKIAATAAVLSCEHAAGCAAEFTADEPLAPADLLPGGRCIRAIASLKTKH